MVENLVIGRGIRDPRVIQAMLDVPRHQFVNEAFQSKAYGDYSLPIGSEQTISNPYTVARMTELLDLSPEDRVLEVGTGCGYQTAVLARLARHVYTIERIPQLASLAEKTLRKLKVINFSLLIGDGSLGWSERAPFKKILATAAAVEPPKLLLEQLDDGGTMVLPVGSGRDQILHRLKRTARRIVSEPCGPCCFVKFVQSS
jgi:protein-L-isoaspartate(D-aspartate) O-methyltransferase